MDIVKLRIPYEFLREHARLNWRSVRYAIENDLLEPSVPSELAAEHVANGKLDSSLLTLAHSRGFERTDLVAQLAGNEPSTTDEAIRDEWLYLVLAWLYENRERYEDPLQRVEEVYADFGYPERIAGFVRYMPMEGTDLGSREANESRLIDRWRQYLDTVRAHRGT